MGHVASPSSFAPQSHSQSYTSRADHQRRLCSSKSVRATRPRNLAPYRNMHSILPPSRNIDTRDCSTRAHCPDVNRSTAEYHYRAVRKPMGLPHVCSGYRRSALMRRRKFGSYPNSSICFR